MAKISVVKKDGDPVAAKVTTARPNRERRRGPRNGTGPRARAGLCLAPTAAEKIAACGRV